MRERSWVMSLGSWVKKCTPFFLALLLLTTHDSRLTTVFALEVDPPRLELAIPASEPTQGQLKIRNSSAKPALIRIQAGEYRAFDPVLRLPSARAWFFFEPDSLRLDSGAAASITYRILPPAEVAQGQAAEYLAAILVDELPEEEPQTDRPPVSKVTVVPRFAMPVYLMIQGKEQVEVEAVDLTPSKGPALGLMRLDLVLHNRGTVHVRPSGTLTILSDNGPVEYSYPVGRALPLLPSATLQVPVVVPLPKPGQYRAVTTVEIAPGQIVQKEAPFEVSWQGEVL